MPLELSIAMHQPSTINAVGEKSRAERAAPLIASNFCKREGVPILFVSRGEEPPRLPPVRAPPKVLPLDQNVTCAAHKHMLSTDGEDPA
jgi:hypothetical protein